MKKIVIIVIGVVFIVFLFYRCQESESTIIINKDQEFVQKSLISYNADGIVPPYSDDVCVPVYPNCATTFGYQIYVVPVSSLIPPGIIGSCELIAFFDICNITLEGIPTVAFSNFSIGYPETSECTALYDYLNNLSEEDRRTVEYSIEHYVKFEAIELYMTNFIELENIECTSAPPFAKAEFYQAICSKKCRALAKFEDPRTFNEYNTNMHSRGGSSGWIYYFVRCGNGCCVTTTEYCLDEFGEVSTSYPDVDIYGDCIPIEPSRWEVLYCSSEVEPCRQRCGN